MKKYAVLVWLILLSSTVFTQKYIKIDSVLTEFYYDYNFQQDSTDSNSEKYQEMVLQVGMHSSKFTSVNILYTDSLLYTVRDLGAAGFSKIWTKISGLRVHRFCEYTLFKNYPNKGNIHFKGGLGPKVNVMVDESINFNWKLQTNSDTIIAKYPCQKATCNFGGRKYVAWYTMVIPISDGPYKFKGLPGLIVRIADTKKEHVFQLYKVKNSNAGTSIINVVEDQYQNSTPQGFAKAMKVYIADMYRKYGGNTDISYSNPDGESKTLRNIRAKNNYIERY
ncbi:GLPGLI family protein [Ancylomarina euxinus]|uniref:GLPGLI family protein n=1 Tax=Ancylomarina euxinus TaxID=2283627 RepID=A0A425Y7E4_9BACT|nr:GLPGLI family protein [Ancylomarina euxinus]MCZ4693657.1 GLPGLI family protein [Ancylomarina euxinus]MUP13886.1 GLPGLI family protein [Ancylomarina euxinus]RRG24485.1 GLPGLI family protein [Ancylomarina euxinus]